MSIVTLKATTRTQSGKGPARRLRAEGMLPIVAYGGDFKTQALSIQRDALRGILTSPRGRNTVIKLEVEGSATVDVMVKDYAVHPISRQILHADFVKISADKPIEVEVPFVTVGKSRGEAAGGTLLANIRSVRVRCLPDAIPDDVRFDVSHLEIDDVVKVNELTLPNGVEALIPPERKIVMVVPPRVLEAAELAAAAPAEGEAAAEGAEGAPAAEGDKKADKKGD